MDSAVTVAAPATGGSVSSFLTSGIRAVTSGFARPRERRRSVSTPCGVAIEASQSSFSNKTNAVTVVAMKTMGVSGRYATTSASNTPSSSTPGSARAVEFASVSALPG